MRSTMASRFAAAAAAVTVATSLISSALASTSIYAESGKLMRSQTGMTTLGPDLFGDKVSMYSGALEFTQTDVSLPGSNALQVSMGRRLEAGAWVETAKAFGNWDYDIPHLHGVFSNLSKWTKSSAPFENRCTGFGPPPSVEGSYGSLSIWNPGEYWHGSFLYVPGAGDQEILSRANSFTATSDPLITTGLWTLRCGVTLQQPSGLSNEYGEGFLAIGPDGTQHRFDWMAVRAMTPIEKGTSAPQSFATVTQTHGKKSTPSPTMVDGNVLARAEVWIMPTLVTDKFGNTVTYAYDTINRWQLNSITASDGRKLTLTWSGGKISTVNDGSRTWTYNYAGNTLQSVLQQDGSSWQVGEMSNLQQTINYMDGGGCTAPPMYDSTPLTASMTHPSGATGTFTLAPVTHGRSFVWKDCRNANTVGAYLAYPLYFDTMALQTKTLSGPGLSPLTWQYFYGPANASFDEPSAQICLDTKIVNVKDPDNNVTRYTFGNRFRVNEGKLLKTESGLSDLTATIGGSPLRMVYMTYRGPTAPANYSQPIGISYQARGNGYLASHLAPMDEKVTVQQDVNFAWRVDPALGDFDAMGRPLGITRSSSLGYSRSEQITYYDNLAKWVIGQTATVTEVSTGKQMMSNGYHPTHGSLISRQAFGLQTESFDYNADGTLAWRKDGNFNTTTYSNYKLGIAQNVFYPENATESAVVNNNGLIASTTDPTGFQSTYDYDAMGRLRLTTYPSGDTPSWTPTTQTFIQSGSAYGLNNTHWMRITQTGNQTEEVHFDAMLRPALTRVYDAADPGNTSRFTVRRFEFGGQQKFESYPQRSISSVDASVPGVSTEHDAMGRVKRTLADSEQGQLITTHSYDSGYVHTTRNPRNYETRTEFFALDEPDEKAPARITLADNTLVEISRDIFGKTRAITRSGNGKSATRSYDYDQYERLCKTVEPETGAAVQTYDNANNVRTRTPGLAPGTACTASLPAASTITFTYDGLNRLKDSTFGDGSPGIFRSYSKDSLLETISSDGADWSYGYNKRRLPTTEKLVIAGATYQLTRGYNSDTTVASLTYPDNSVIQYAPNALNEPRQVGGYASNISRYPNGAVAGFTYGNGIVHSLTQNARGLPEQARDAGILSDVYGYDVNGNVGSITDQQEGVTTRTMEYDAVDRLTKVTAPNLWGTATYGYDSLDNLTNTSLGGATARSTTHNFDSATNLLTSISSTVGAYNLGYGYDTRGNITQRGTQAYAFDLANRMRSATGKANYGYDGHGRRAQVANVDGTNRIQVYDQAGQLRYVVQTGGPNPALTTKYIYLDRHALAEVASGVVQYDHNDALGSPVARTNAAGAIVTRTRYEPYGMTAAGTNPDGIGFTGHVNDTNTGLVQMQQRYYDPIAGRFLSLDPVLTDVTSGAGFNRYAYANNSPFSYVDPDGRAVESITVDRNKNVHIVMGMTYQGAITPAQAARLNAAIINKWSGKFGPYAVNLTIVPGSQAKFGNIVTVIAGNGRAVTSGNGARQTTLYTQDLAGKSIEAVMAHETEHLFGVAKIPADKYYSNGQPIPGWERNIMSDPNGSVDERNIEDMLSFGRPYLGKESQGGESSTSQSSSDGQGCMRKGGDCWH